MSVLVVFEGLRDGNARTGYRGTALLQAAMGGKVTGRGQRIMLALLRAAASLFSIVLPPHTLSSCEPRSPDPGGLPLFALNLGCLFGLNCNPFRRRINMIDHINEFRSPWSR